MDLSIKPCLETPKAMYAPGEPLYERRLPQTDASIKNLLKKWGREKMTNVLQTAFSNSIFD